jgi:arylsulfatase A
MLSTTTALVRRTLRTATALALACLLLPAVAHAGERPNIIYFISDDLGVGDISHLNPDRGRIHTPHADELAKQGTTFTDAHAPTSICTPSRYAILTGRYPWRTHLRAGVLHGQGDDSLIAPDRLTVAEMLRQQGYHTAAFGKWHLGLGYRVPDGATLPPDAHRFAGQPVDTRVLNGPIDRGFDYFFGFDNSRTIASIVENDRVVEVTTPIQVLPMLTRRAVAYIDERAGAARDGQPFFMWFASNAPHTPIVPAEPWQNRSEVGRYGDFVMQNDACLGELLDALDRHDLTDNTLVIFTADNGVARAAGVNQLEAQGHFSSAGFRGYKQDIWEGGHRVPFVIRWPGHVPAGRVAHQPIALHDLFATLAEILGVELPDDAAEDSISKLAEWVGEPRTQPRPPIVHQSSRGRLAIRDGAWKLIFGPGSGGVSQPTDARAERAGLPPVQLYDLDADHAETRNLHADYDDVVDRLTAAMQDIIDRGRSRPGPRASNDVPVQIEPPRGRTRPRGAQALDDDDDDSSDD